MGTIVISQKIAYSGDLQPNSISFFELSVNVALSIRPGAELLITQSSEAHRTFLTATIIDPDTPNAPVSNVEILAAKITYDHDVDEHALAWFNDEVAKKSAAHPNAKVITTQSSEENQTFLVVTFIYLQETF